MRVDFYQLSRDPVERVVAMLARKVVNMGQRLLVVSEDPGQRAVMSTELWRVGPEEFLANGEASAPAAERQPVLFADVVDRTNGAGILLLADGKWRAEALQFDRVLLLFSADQTEAARALWRELDGEEGVTREIHKQDERGRWQAGA